MKPPEPQRGAFFGPRKVLRTFRGCSGLDACHPLPTRGDDLVELVADQAAEPAVDGRQQAERDEDPGLGIGIALGNDAARLLRAADHVGHERMDFAHLGSEGPPDLRIVGSLRAHLLPDSVQTREVELPLRGEVPEEHGLRDAGLAGDLRRRGAVVAALGEDAARRLDDSGLTLRPGQPDSGFRHAATSGTTCSSSAWYAGLRNVATATRAAEKAITAATSSARWNPLMNWGIARGSV